jgi:hypothetical protein
MLNRTEVVLLDYLGRTVLSMYSLCTRLIDAALVQNMLLTSLHLCGLKQTRGSSTSALIKGSHAFQDEL